MNRKVSLSLYSSIVVVSSIFLMLSSYFSDFFVVKTRPHNYDFITMNIIVLLFCLFLYVNIGLWIKELHNTVASLKETEDKIILHLISNKDVELQKKDLLIEKKLRCSVETNSILDVYLIAAKSKKKYLLFKKDLTTNQIEIIEALIEGEKEK